MLSRRPPRDASASSSTSAPRTLDLYHVWPYTITWFYGRRDGVDANTSCRISGYLYEHASSALAAAYLAATAASTLVALAGFLTLTGIKAWPVQSDILMLIPIVYLLVSRLYKAQSGQHSLFAVAHLATIVLTFSVLFSALNIAQPLEPVVGVQTNLPPRLLPARLKPPSSTHSPPS